VASQHRRLEEILAAAGVEPARLEFIGSPERAAHLDAYSRIDIAPEPLPHGSGITPLEALWMGVSVIAFRRHVLVAAGDLPALAAARQTLRGRVAGSAFGDAARHARAVEAAYSDSRSAPQAIASIGVGASLALPIIGKLLGHAHVQTTHRYAHLELDPAKRSAEFIVDRLAAAIGEAPVGPHGMA
jgi:hypothetical protein